MSQEARTITAIKPLPSDPLRCSIRVGKRKAATLSRDRIEALGLKPGQSWDDALAERVQTAEAAEKVRHKAMQTISRRMIGSAELADRLKQRGHPPDAVDAAISELRDKNLLDDEAYARALVRQQRARQPAGRRLLQQKLMQKKLPREIVQRVLDETEQDTDAVAEARRLAEKRLRSPSLRRCEPAKRKQRLYGALARRGFDTDTIRQALDNLPDLNTPDTDPATDPATGSEDTEATDFP